MYLLLAFIAVPVIEIFLFIKVGGLIGVWATIAIVLFTAFLGTSLLRIQGLAVLRRAQESAERNELPVAEVFDGLCLLVAGVLLLTPGFFTDTLGFLLLVPVFRRVVGLAVWRWMARHGNVSFHVGGFGGPGASRGPRDGGSSGDGPVIEGDFEEVDTPPADRDRLGPSDRS